MTLSMNEVEATAKRAARGAGFSWGLAEEAAKATRWLCAHGIDGCAALAGLLERIDPDGPARWSPVIENETWRASAGMLCPITSGAAISDRAKTVDGKEVRLENIAQPILLAPFLAVVAEQIGKPATVTGPDCEATTDGTHLTVRGTFPAVAAWASIKISGKTDETGLRCRRADPAPTAWTQLNAFAKRTYAPATEESRLKGAGAGRTDND